LFVMSLDSINLFWEVDTLMTESCGLEKRRAIRCVCVLGGGWRWRTVVLGELHIKRCRCVREKEATKAVYSYLCLLLLPCSITAFFGNSPAYLGVVLVAASLVWFRGYRRVGLVAGLLGLSLLRARQCEESDSAAVISLVPFLRFKVSSALFIDITDEFLSSMVDLLGL
jgi:hypothetical protein